MAPPGAVESASATANLTGLAEPIDWTVAWAQALDRLELDVEETERLLTGNSPSSAQTQASRWVAPTDLGPLPESLQERAIRVHARQIETGRRLALALGATRRESDLAHRLSHVGTYHSPLYVDHLM